MLYFAYGSNMDPVQMAKRCPGAKALGPAVLAGHRLTFTWDSERWRGGVGHVLEDPGEDVWGVLWELGPSDEESLDRWERVADGVYRKATVTVATDAGPVGVMIYLCNDLRPKKPSRRYMRALIRGARNYALPEDYITRLASVATNRF